MLPHVLLMVCGINVAVYCYAAQKEKRQTGLCLRFPTAGKDLTVHNNQGKATKTVLAPIWAFSFL